MLTPHGPFYYSVDGVGSSNDSGTDRKYERLNETRVKGVIWRRSSEPNASGTGRNASYTSSKRRRVHVPHVHLSQLILRNPCGMY